MINAGAILVCSLLKTLVKPEMTLAEKFDYTMNYFKVSALRSVNFENIHPWYLTLCFIFLFNSDWQVGSLLGSTMQFSYQKGRLLTGTMPSAFT